MGCECLHKIEVQNPLTGQLHLVPCGTCPACIYRSSVRKELKCKANRPSFKYCYFISLTYNVYNCPSCTIDKQSLPGGECICTLRYSHHRDEFLASGHPLARKGYSRREMEPYVFRCTEEYYERYTSQANLAIRKHFFDHRFDGYYGVLNHYDLSLFMKRFRKYLYSKTNFYEPLETYIVGEYGIEHFRPHFHLLLYFNNDSYAENLGEALNKCWPFGSADYSFARENAIQYTAGYVNSVVFLPRHLKEFRPIAPFSRFSNGFGSKLFESLASASTEVRKFKCLNGELRTVDGELFHFFPSVQVRDSCFFRAASYPRASVSALSELLHSVVKSVSAIPTKTRAKTLFGLTRQLVDFFSDSRFCRKVFSYKAWLPILKIIGVDQSNISSFVFPDFKKRIHQRLYRLYSQCQRFLGYSKKSLFDLVIDIESLYLRLVESIVFYNEYDFKNYQNYCQSRNDYPCDIRRYFYRVSSYRLKQFRRTSLGESILSYQYQLLHNRVKHREINEKNKFFVSI